MDGNDRESLFRLRRRCVVGVPIIVQFPGERLLLLLHLPTLLLFRSYDKPVPSRGGIGYGGTTVQNPHRIGCERVHNNNKERKNTLLLAVVVVVCLLIQKAFTFLDSSLPAGGLLTCLPPC